MLYHWYELGHAAVKPARVASHSIGLFFNNPFNPLTHTSMGRHAAAACEVFERTTRRYDKPEFDLPTTTVDGETVAVTEETVWQRSFCRLKKFSRDIDPERAARDPKILLIAPMSGHYATLLRGTVETLLPDHEVYITDWIDARDVPITAGVFNLDTYIDYIIEMLHHFEGDVHAFAVCQPSVPLLAAVSVMEAAQDPFVPRSIILAGGPVDTRISPTKVNRLAEQKGTDWFAGNVITTVPWPRTGFGRMVYPGFLQLTGFMTMNLDRHVAAHKNLFNDLVRGDGDSAEKHREFYDEYLAVMDLTAEFYLQTIDTVFVRHSLPRGVMKHRGVRVDPSAIRRVALMTIEGEKDDITGIGQCRAAHDLCTSLAPGSKMHYECPGVGHYGIFNGSRFRSDIAPRIAQFVRVNDTRSCDIPSARFAERILSALRPTQSVHEISSVAFTFAPANDTAPDRMAEKLRTQGLGGEYRTVEAPHAAPFRLWELASRLMIDGMFQMPATSSTHALKMKQRDHGS